MNEKLKRAGFIKKVSRKSMPMLETEARKPPPNKKMQLTIAKAARLATPIRAPFAIAADL